MKNLLTPLLLRYNDVLSTLNKVHLRNIDKNVFCDDVTDFYGHDFTKYDILTHLSLFNEVKTNDALNVINKVITYIKDNSLNNTDIRIQVLRDLIIFIDENIDDIMNNNNKEDIAKTIEIYSIKIQDKKTEIQKLESELNILYHELNLKAVQSITIEIKILYKDINVLRDLFTNTLKRLISC